MDCNVQGWRPRSLENKLPIALDSISTLTYIFSFIDIKNASFVHMANNIDNTNNDLRPLPGASL